VAEITKLPVVSIMNEQIARAAEILQASKFTTAYTGAGISVESGIPPFRGDGGLWSKYPPESLDIDYFLRDPEGSWKVIREIFFDFFKQTKYNQAHFLLAEMQKHGLIHRIITQNIDNLHQEAGSTQVFEFHGNSKSLICLVCLQAYHASEVDLSVLPPRCSCGGLLKPDFVFFGEPIPMDPLNAAHEAARLSDVFLIIGTTGEVMPANMIPPMAKANGAKIIEINPEESNYTRKITDVFLKGKATTMMQALYDALFSPPLENN